MAETDAELAFKARQALKELIRCGQLLSSRGYSCDVQYLSAYTGWHEALSLFSMKQYEFRATKTVGI